MDNINNNITGRDSEEEQIDTHCPICLEELGTKNIFITKCGHTFCGDCMITNTQITNTCPICRQNVVESVTDEQITRYENQLINRDLQSTYANIIIDSIRGILRIYQEAVVLSSWEEDSNYFKIELIGILNAYEADLEIRNDVRMRQSERRRPMSISDMDYDSIDEIIATIDIPEN